MCTRLVVRLGPVLGAAGFRHEPLRAPWVVERLHVIPERLLAEIRVLTADGRTLGGADAVVHVARKVCDTRPSWWAWLLILFGKMPFGMRLLRQGYRWFAARHHCRQGTCIIPKSDET